MIVEVRGTVEVVRWLLGFGDKATRSLSLLHSSR